MIIIADLLTDRLKKDYVEEAVAIMKVLSKHIHNPLVYTKDFLTVIITDILTNKLKPNWVDEEDTKIKELQDRIKEIEKEIDNLKGEKK